MDVELIVNQRGDKFVGVVFGEKLEETLKEAKDKVQNPPKLNIIVPVATDSNGLVEGWGKDKLPKITYKYKIKYYKYNKYEYEYEYESIEKRDEKANSLPASGYRYKGKNTDAVVTDAAGWFTAGKEEHTITTEYNRNPVTIYIKSNGKELLEDVGYVENGKTYILYSKSFFGTLGYSYLENNKKTAYKIQKDSGTKHTINKLLLGKTTLDHVAISDVCSAVQKDTNGTKVLREQSTHTATFVLGTGQGKLIDKAMKLTMAFEGQESGYTVVTNNFDNAGISVGKLQWNLGQGTLQPMLIEFFDNYDAKAKNIFGNNYDSINNMLDMSSVSSQVTWAEGIHDSKNNIKSDWKNQFIKLCETTEFQEIQDSASLEYVNQAYKIVADFGLKSERGLALAFDIAVQSWYVSGSDSIKKEAKNGAIEQILLELVAQGAVNKASDKWREDVKIRKFTIVNGMGTVHGKKYNLETQYDITMRNFVK